MEKFKKRTEDRANKVLKNIKIQARVSAPAHPTHYELGLLRELTKRLLMQEIPESFIQKHEYGIYLNEAKKEAFKKD